VVAEAVELEPQDDDVDTENEDDGRRRRELDHNLAMNNFADQITQHISDRIPLCRAKQVYVTRYSR
jgi:hypothetical protein